MRDAALPVMGVVVLLLPLDIFSVAILVFERRRLVGSMGGLSGRWFESSFTYLKPSP